MGKKPSSPTEVDDLRPLLDGIAKNLVERLYGPEGPAWGTSFADVEGIAVALRNVLSERLLYHALTRQAQHADGRPPDYQACPSCGGPLQPREPEPRLVHSRAGDAEWTEPHFFCSACRRAFFPSIQEPGP
jgi:hypothetical protein